MRVMFTAMAPERMAGMLFVVALHAVALWQLWQHRLLPMPTEAMTLFVNFIAPPAPERKEEPKRRPTPAPKPVEKPQPRQLVAETPAVAPADRVAPPLPVPAPEPAAPPPMPLPSGPVALSSELSVVCPERPAPAYPAFSRRLGETGTVVLRVELDETGYVGTARVQTSSGHPRLDDAALAVVRSWRCQPAQRNGQPVRAVALQPFKFVLQGD